MYRLKAEFPRDIDPIFEGINNMYVSHFVLIILSS